MISNRIRALRKAAGKTLQQVAADIGSTTTTVQRLEKGEVELVHPLLESLARALGVGWLDLLGVGPTQPIAALAESAAPYVAGPGDPLAVDRLGMYESPFVARDNSLSRLGIDAGDVIVFDVSAKAVRQVATGDVVVAQVYGPGLANAVTVMREYVAPSLLITNRRAGRQDIIDLDEVDAAIKGIATKRWGPIGRR
jgi:transcriptional regulator with XRE-family HTH domain